MGRGIDGRVGAAHRFEDADGKTVARPCFTQQLGRAAPAVAEGAVPADDDMSGADRTHDDVGNKILGALGGKAEIEMLDKKEIDAEPRQFALLDAKGRQPERLGRRKKDAARMRLEGQHRGRPALPAAELARLRDQRRMTLVQPVEIAHRQHRWARMARSRAGMSDDADHGDGRCSFDRFQNTAKIACPVPRA